jgi:hypothetical protein
MRLYEFDQSIQELSYTDPGIKKHLAKLGYKSAGEGGDQTTWIGPDGGILKIFGTQEGQTGMTADHRMFAFWAKFSKANASNPYMPRFSGWTEFEFPQGSGQTYLQIKMEKLSPVSDSGEENILDYMKWSVEQGRSFEEYKSILSNKFGNKILKSPLLSNTQLWDTVSNINNIGAKHGWGLDLHSENYMKRGNQVVIVDPWVASS